MVTDFPNDKFNVSLDAGHETEYAEISFGLVPELNAFLSCIPEGHRVIDSDLEDRKIKVAPPLGKPAIRKAIVEGLALNSGQAHPTRRIGEVVAPQLNDPE